MNRRRELGKKGELMVEKYYLNLGYKLLERNWRSGKKELDLIFSKNKKIFFVEVKSRNFNYLDFKEVPLNKSQVKNLKEAILDYCYLKKINPERVYLDLFLIIFYQKNKKIVLKKYHNILN
ncbi:YraN family protein [Patescibacteria group bacterium]|nr:YraN family protein [Patescibacteria group bacterium]